MKENVEDYEHVTAYRNAMIADGWTMRALYGPTEPMESYAHGEKEGFTCHVKSRDHVQQSERFPYLKNARPKQRYMCSVTVWAPDGAVIQVPSVYSWEAIKAQVMHCPKCGADNVKTVRVAFANRACEKCAPALRAKLETPGWCD